MKMPYSMLGINAKDKKKKKKQEKETEKSGKTSQVPFAQKSKGREKASGIFSRRASLARRTERTKALMRPVCLEKHEKRESRKAAG